MGLVSAKCPYCGGDLKIDDSKQTAKCPYCKSEFLVETAIGSITNITNNYYMESDDENDKDKAKKDAYKEKILFFIKSGDFDKAEKEIKKFMEKWPQDESGSSLDLYCLCKFIQSNTELVKFDVFSYKSEFAQKILYHYKHFGDNFKAYGEEMRDEFQQLYSDTNNMLNNYVEAEVTKAKINNKIKNYTVIGMIIAIIMAIVSFVNYLWVH